MDVADHFVAPWALRARFAGALSRMYAAEVPAYGDLVKVCNQINREALGDGSRKASRTEDLGTLARITAERHGAIRVGSPAELRRVARLFALLGMEPVGFYDLREAKPTSLPVVSTAFRPVDPDDLARNAFRVFTSMLVPEDRRFFDEDLGREISERVAARSLLANGLEVLIGEAEDAGGVARERADDFIRLAVATFELSPEPLDAAWHERLFAISPVAADIAAAPGTHVNHLTPRVLDIDELYRRMEARGIEMIDRIQGPPAWSGPDVLLRQTSFRALDEVRTMRLADGSTEQRRVRVRFGEVEQRGVALTPDGRRLVDELLAKVEAADHRDERARQRAAADAFDASLPRELTTMALAGLAHVRFEAHPGHPLPPPGGRTLAGLVTSGALEVHPIVYEDFLPKSAAGIFRSNLDHDGRRDDDRDVAHWDSATMEEAIGRPLLDPYDLYDNQQQASLRDALDVLGIADLD
ncbi:MAG: VOC family protein [Nitriliruptorales bacterium]|nr:VOC family protein [Nitriliruptorales bacterium]